MVDTKNRKMPLVNANGHVTIVFLAVFMAFTQTASNAKRLLKYSNNFLRPRITAFDLGVRLALTIL